MWLTNFMSFFSLENNNSKKYLLVMEYANNGTLQKYLKEHFDDLTWNDKIDLALQLAYAVSCLHDEGIVHRDLVINLHLIDIIYDYNYLIYLLGLTIALW